MATIKSFTSVEQSKKLAEILPLESADCFWDYDDLQKYHRISWFEEGYDKNSQLRSNENNVCAWSLAALLEQLPYEVCDDDGNSFYLQINKENDIYQLTYTDPYEDFDVIETDRHEHFVDACYELITKLYEKKLL